MPGIAGGLFPVHGIPPLGGVLEVFGEPGHYRVLPYATLVGVGHYVVGAFYRDKLNVAAEDAEGVEEETAEEIAADEMETVEDVAEETDALTRKDYDFLKKISPNTLTILQGFAEPAIRDCENGTSFQFVRVGYFCKDPDSTAELPVFNRTVELNGMKL